MWVCVTVSHHRFRGFSSMLSFIKWKIFHWERDLVEIHRVLKVHWKEPLSGFRMREIKYNKLHSMVLSRHRIRKRVFQARL